MAFHTTVLSQFLKLLPRHEFEKLAKGHDLGVRSDALSRWSQFVAMAVGHLGERSSLRDIESTLRSQSAHCYHLGSQRVSRARLARANADRDAAFFSDLFGLLYQRCTTATPGHPFCFKRKLFSLDGSLLDVSMKVFPWADYNTKKAAFKLHVGLDHEGFIPAFAALTLGKDSEADAVDLSRFPKGSVLVFDRGYRNYSWANALTDKGYIWVTRIRSNAQYRVIERRPTPVDGAITSDQIIEYTGAKARREPLHRLRRVGYRDPQTKRHYVFISNQFEWSAQTIAELYKQRWQVELFFKWIKQNLKIKTFLGTTRNAVATQVFVALCLYLLLAFFKFQARLAPSLQQILRLLHMNLFIRRPILELFAHATDPPSPNPQLRLGLIPR